MEKLPVCWIITDGKAGMESQCLGLAEALGLEPQIKRIRLRRLWRIFSPYLNIGRGFSVSSKGDPIKPPWPDIVIASGRLSVIPSLFVKKKTGGKSFHIQIQNPVVPPDLFDLVVVPSHDKLQGRNVITIEGALHRVTSERLKTGAEKWRPRLGTLLHPIIAVLLGGSNDNYRLDPKTIMQLGAQLEALAHKENATLLVTPSRRTGTVNTVLLSALLHDTRNTIWNGHGENPYYGMLGLADAILVTCDSVNMISEACATGKPVHIIRLPGHSEKFASFHEYLVRTGRARFFNGALERWDYPPLREMERLASIIHAAYMAHRGSK
jgi:mitochondrial fission protein ELM1